MIDLHSQILLPGELTPNKLKEILQLAKAASKAGFKKLVATPVVTCHTELASTYEYDLKKCEYINNLLRENKIDIEIYMGNEIYDSPEVTELLKTSHIASINNTRYILLKYHEKDCNFYTIIDSVFKLQIAGYTPIISQIEKYDFVVENHNNVKDLIRRDILIQLDVLSITGEYGEKIKKISKELLKGNMVHIIGTNANTVEQYAKSSHALSKIKKIVGNATFQEISVTNSECILNNEVIYPSTPKETKKHIFR